MAAGVLAVLAIAVGCPEAWSAEIPEASVTGGVAAPPTTPERSPAPVPGAAQPKALDDGSAGGGATAPPATASEPAPAVESPGDAPREPAPVAPLANARSSETAVRPPVQPSQVEPPPAAGAPANLNVDIRIFSPGDNGDVIQLTGTSGGGAGGPGGPAVGSDWDWDWDWTCGPGQGPLATAAGWKWDWDWDCGGLAGAPGGRGDDEPVRRPSEATPTGVTPGVDAPHTQGSAPVERGRSPAEPGAESPGRHGGGARFTADRAPGAVGVAAAYALPLMAAAGPPARSVETGRPRDPEASKAPAGPFQAPAMARPAAATQAPPGGSSSVLLVVLLGALSLLAPRAIGTVWGRIPRFASRIGSHRLERPG